MNIQRFRYLIKGLISGKFILYKGRSNDRVVALTFDDGPCNELTGRILDILRKEKVKATFFLVGKEAERYPGLVKVIHQDGHAIGMHSYAHQRTSQMSRQEIHSEMQRTDRLIREITGKPACGYRPPYGEISLQLLWCAMLNLAGLVFWSVDLHDSFIKEPQELIDNLNAVKLHSGDIILLHDDSRPTAVALSELIAKVRSQGFSFVTIEEMLMGRKQ